MKYWISMALVFALACSSDKKEAEIQSTNNDKSTDLLVGSWENLSMIVRMPDSTIKVAEGHWGEVLGIKPIITTFSQDGSYVSEYRTLEDSVFMTKAGAWVIEGDSLIMIDGESPNKYHFELFGDTVLFTGYLDWDQDGLNNDHYAGKQIRVSED